jgi:hypothetical protein
MPDASDRIRDLAYRVWEEEGCPEGRETDHWLQAERMLQSEPTLPVKRAGKAQRPNPVPKRAARVAKIEIQPSP